MTISPTQADAIFAKVKRLTARAWNSGTVEANVDSLLAEIKADLESLTEIPTQELGRWLCRDCGRNAGAHADQYSPSFGCLWNPEWHESIGA